EDALEFAQTIRLGHLIVGWSALCKCRERRDGQRDSDSSYSVHRVLYWNEVSLIRQLMLLGVVGEPVWLFSVTCTPTPVPPPHPAGMMVPMRDTWTLRPPSSGPPGVTCTSSPSCTFLQRSVNITLDDPPAATVPKLVGALNAEYTCVIRAP